MNLKFSGDEKQLTREISVRSEKDDDEDEIVGSKMEVSRHKTDIPNINQKLFLFAHQVAIDNKK